MDRKPAWITAAVNSIILEELKKLDQVFSQPPSIPVVVLKGGAFAFTLYPDLALRPLSDIDLLVPEERLEEAAARLKALGYKELNPEIVPNHRRNVETHFSFVREGIPLTLELHWSLAAGKHSLYAPDMAWFWAHTEPLPLPFPTSLQTLDPTAHLLYLAVHATFCHGEAKLDPKWLYDIHLLVEREGRRINWGELVGQAASFHWADAVARAFERCSQLFGTRFPEEVLRLLEKDRDEATIKLLERKAFPHRKGVMVWDTFKTLDWHGRFSLLRAILLPSPAFVRWRYQPKPPWIWPLFYVYRWFDVMREGVHLLWGK
ncbi:MAG: nucleotidyltransferase family protein [Anaerolineae bacterium]|nr:nucleotidyltransferase family protein [Anaerolineae bacterium]MDW8103032.1 nucleotidyltransferase family protein [Anaerolineae bacterium]